MKKVALLFCAVFCIVILATINQGCNLNPTEAAPKNETPKTVTFSITNIGGYVTSVCTGDNTCVSECVPTVGDPTCGSRNVTTTATVDYIKLTRNSTGAVYKQACSIPNGTSANVIDTIPANDTYTVVVDAGNERYSNTWNSVSLTRGSTYYMNLTGGSTSTLDSIAGSGNF